MTATEKPLLLGAVDLGSNSFRVEVGRVVDDRAEHKGRVTGSKFWVRA